VAYASNHPPAGRFGFGRGGSHGVASAGHRDAPAGAAFLDGYDAARWVLGPLLSRRLAAGGVTQISLRSNAPAIHEVLAVRRT
jgi:hypothetical protein